MMRSLRLRLLFGALVAVGLSLSMVWYALGGLFTAYAVHQYEQEMTSIADSIAARLQIDGGKVELARQPRDPRFDLPAGGHYWQVNLPEGKPKRSRSLWDREIADTILTKSGYGNFGRMEGPGGNPILVYTLSTSLEDAGKSFPVTIHAAFDERELTQSLSAFHGELRRMLGATALLLLAAAFLQASIGLAPLSRMQKQVARIRSGERRNLGDDGPSEIGPLVKEINLLIEERETALERARARASDLAHGLKTPLTVLSNLAEKLSSDDQDMALRQVDLIRQRADRQLQAARLGVEQMATTDIGSLAAKLVQVFRPVTTDRGVTIRIENADGVTIAMDAADLAEALGNIIDNAVKFARSSILLAVRTEDRNVTISIGDDGPGIAEEDRLRVLERGQTLDDSRGHGLGLAISQDIVTAYGGTLAIGRSELGGAELVISLPKDPGGPVKASPA